MAMDRSDWPTDLLAGCALLAIYGTAVMCDVVRFS
jgi:hypothetical protein